LQECLILQNQTDNIGMKNKINRFNIRVYGIVFDHKGRLLLTDEFRLGIRMTKFPGGGLNFGEGTIDCLRREFMEELNQEIDAIEHFYTTDFFQPTSLLAETQQLISIYYKAQPVATELIPLSEKPFDFEDIDGAQSFRFVDLQAINPEQLTFPIDRKVLLMLRSGK